jgi:S-adenosylmethionine:diacylglycerol 3-amino-3-carboxypropyl transferase
VYLSALLFSTDTGIIYPNGRLDRTVAMSATMLGRRRRIYIVAAIGDGGFVQL